MLREMVYRVVKVEYRHMVETGELPRHSLDRHVDLVRGRGGDADTTESQRDMLDLTMTNAWSATTTAASTHTRHRGTEELSEI